MKTRNSPSKLLLASLCALTCALTAGLPGWAADSKAPDAKTKAGKNAPVKAPAKAEAKAEGARAPLKITVDTKPINRDSADRVSYAPIIKRTASSVVYVHSSKRIRMQDMYPFLSDPRYRRFFDGLGIPFPEDEDGSVQPDGRSRPNQTPNNRGNRKGGGGSGGGNSSRGRGPSQVQQGLGSGVVITADGYILTNNHVVEGADEVKVSIGESPKRYDTKIVGRDAFSDLAVLKIEAAGLTPAVFGDSEQLQVGDVVLAIGNPFGVGQSVSRGIVSALSRGVGIGPIEDFIQTDAAINPGNSGGALIDTEGRVVGINTAILSRSGGFAGVGFAIPINLARTVAEQIVNTGRVNRGYLGVAYQDIEDEALASQFGTEKGAIIAGVEEESPAQKAGLKPGDVITKVNNNEIRDSRHLLLAIGQMTPGTQVAVEYLRDGKTQTAQVKLASRPENADAADERSVNPGSKDVGVLNGVTVGEITPQMRTQLQLPARVKGAIITEIDPDSPSAQQGLREGDIIQQLNNIEVTNAEEAVKASEEIKGPKVGVLIWRNGRASFVAIDESKE